MAPSLSRTLPLWLTALILPFGCTPDPIVPGSSTPGASASPTATVSGSPFPVISGDPSPIATPTANTSLPPDQPAASPSASAAPATMAGTIVSVVGVGAKGFYGDDNYAATDVKMASPWGISIYGSDLWIADSGNARVRIFRPDKNTVQTMIGTGSTGFNGDNKAATSTNLSNPMFVITSGAGHIYVADTYANRIRKIDKVTGILSTVAGNGSGGFTGDGGSAVAASLANPTCVAIGGSETLYIADSGNHVIRRVTSAGTITTVAGTGQGGFSNDGKTGTSAQLRYPEGVIAGEAGNIYIADSGNNRIRKLTADGVISTVAGDGTQGFAGDGGPATKAKLNRPIGMTMMADGSLVFADGGNARIRAIRPDGTIQTIAGNGTKSYGGDGGPALSASFGLPAWVARDDNGDLYVSDAGNGALDQRIRKITFTK
jgi:hypothetical protein